MTIRSHPRSRHGGLWSGGVSPQSASDNEDFILFAVSPRVHFRTVLRRKLNSEPVIGGPYPHGSVTGRFRPCLSTQPNGNKGADTAPDPCVPSTVSLRESRSGFDSKKIKQTDKGAYPAILCLSTNRLRSDTNHVRHGSLHINLAAHGNMYPGILWTTLHAPGFAACRSCRLMGFVKIKGIKNW